MLLICLFLFALTRRAIASSLFDAQKAYLAGYYVKAEKLVHPLAEQGNGVAQYTLGLMYESNNGVTQDYCEVGSGVDTNCDAIIVSGDVSFAEGFAGQTNTPFDHVHFLLGLRSTD